MSTSNLNLNDPFEPDPEEPSKIEPEREAEPAWWRALHSRLPKLGIHGRIPWEPLRRLSLLALLVLGAVLLWRGVEKSLRSIPPGWVGVSVNRLTGSVAVLDPGTFLRPSALFQIHPVRISDQLLSGDEGQFNVTTKEGVLARVSVQARWAISRKSLLATWSALPQRPGEELVAPVLFAAFRTAAPRYEVLKLIADQREELSAVAAATARERLAESGIVLKEVLIGDLQLTLIRCHVAELDQQRSHLRLARGALNLQLQQALDHAELAQLPVNAPRLCERLPQRGVELEGVLEVLQGADRELNDSLGVVGTRGGLVLVGRYAEQEDRGDAERGDLARLFGEVRDGQPLDARHRLDRLTPVGAVGHEKGQHQMARRQVGLAHEVPQTARPAQPAKARSWKGHALSLPRYVRPPG